MINYNASPPIYRFQNLSVMHQQNFPINSLPCELRNMMLAFCEQTQAPLELNACAVLSAISLACQGLIDVKYKDNLTAPVSLFMLAVAESGERKSSVDRLVMQPFHQHDQQIMEDRILELKKYSTQLLTWETKRSAILSVIKRKAKRNEPTCEEEQHLDSLDKQKPGKPNRLKFLYNNTTPEALLADMNGSYASVGLFADEGGNILDRRIAQDLSTLNMLWDGATISVDRKTSDSLYIKEGRLTLNVMVQESVFNQFLARQGDVARGSGFFARCLPVSIDYTLSTKGTRFTNKVLMYQRFIPLFHQRIQALMEHPIQHPDNAEIPRITLRFSPNAQYQWDRFYNEVEEQIAPGGCFAEIGDFASKLANNAARLAALFQYFSDGGEIIQEDMVNEACDVITWYAHQMLRMFAPEAECLQQAKHAQQLLTWLQKKFYALRYPVIKKNDIRRLGPQCTRNKDALNDALDILSQSGHITLLQRDKGPIYVHSLAGFSRPLFAGNQSSWYNY
jgi:hypothetical protein